MCCCFAHKRISIKTNFISLQPNYWVWELSKATAAVESRKNIFSYLLLEKNNINYISAKVFASVVLDVKTNNNTESINAFCHSFVLYFGCSKLLLAVAPLKTEILNDLSQFIHTFYPPDAEGGHKALEFSRRGEEEANLSRAIFAIHLFLWLCENKLKTTVGYFSYKFTALECKLYVYSWRGKKFTFSNCKYYSSCAFIPCIYSKLSFVIAQLMFLTFSFPLILRHCLKGIKSLVD